MRAAAEGQTAAHRRLLRSWRSLLVLIAVVLVAMTALQRLREASQARLGEQVARLARPADIRMIASVDCVYCAAARRWFEANRVPFSECEIERDTDCAALYAAWMAPGTPVLLVRGRRLLGFDPQAVADALNGTPPAL